MIAKLDNSSVYSNGKLSKAIKGRMEYGLSIKFWIDPWLFEEPLGLVFPLLFAEEAKKGSVVADRIVMNNGVAQFRWEWKNSIINGGAASELLKLIVSLQNVSLSNTKDTWSWVGDDEGRFSTVSIKKLLKGDVSPPAAEVLNWNGWLPIKVNVFVWRTLLYRIATNDKLMKRRILVGPDMCVLCSSAGETVNPSNMDEEFLVCVILLTTRRLRRRRYKWFLWWLVGVFGVLETTISFPMFRSRWRKSLEKLKRKVIYG